MILCIFSDFLDKGCHGQEGVDPGGMLVMARMCHKKTLGAGELKLSQDGREPQEGNVGRSF